MNSHATLPPAEAVERARDRQRAGELKRELARQLRFAAVFAAHCEDHCAAGSYEWLASTMSALGTHVAVAVAAEAEFRSLCEKYEAGHD